MSGFSKRAYVLVLICLAASAFGKAAKQRVICRVKVVDMSCRPISRAEVVANEYFYDLADAQVRTELICRGRTDSEGIAILKIEAADIKHNVYIIARKKGLAVGCDRLGIHAGSVHKMQVTILLDKPDILSGTVVGQLGKPIASARVHAYLRSDSKARFYIQCAPEDWFTVETNDKGRFSFHDIPPDTIVKFLVTSPGRTSIYSYRPSEHRGYYSYVSGQTDIRIELPQEARIRGRVIGPNSRPVAGVKLLARQSDISGRYDCANRAISGQDGGFLFEGVAADSYSLQVVAPFDTMAQWVARDIKVVAKEGQTTDGVVVRVSKGGLVDVVVRDAANDQPLNNVWVCVRQGARFGSEPCFYQGLRTGTNGHVRIRAPFGESRLVVIGRDSARYDGIVIVRAARPFLQNVLFRYGPSVSGTVFEKSGKPAVGAIVGLTPLFNIPVLTDRAGRFHVTRAARHHDIYLFARDPERNYAAIVEVKDDSRPINVVLKPAIKIVGTVTDPNGAPIPLARVRPSIQGRVWSSYIGVEILTDKDGRYEIPAIPMLQKDCSYHINASAIGYGPLQREKITLDPVSRNRVHLEPLVLQPLNMTVSGYVVDRKGNRVPNKTVILRGRREGPGQPTRQYITNANGEFFFERISNAPVMLSVGSARSKDYARVDAMTGDENVKIVLGQKRVHTNSTSLIGKPLPDLGKFDLKSASEVAAGKKILVCFWDMNQRPSRNCVQRLGKRAQLLANKGVYTVLIYTGTIVESALSDWLRRYNVAIPVGRMKGNIQELGRTWAVQSLPWLILTDRKHIVTAEGFSLAELSEKIKISNDF